MTKQASDNVVKAPTPAPKRSVYVVLTVLIQAACGIALVVHAVRGDWENVALTSIVIVLMLLPALLDKQFRIVIPPEFQCIAAAFIFLSLILGSATDFYYKFWWWDSVLHIGSGFLLGFVGFIVMLALNRTDRIPSGIRPGFLCFFAVTFAVFMGVIWEIFEFLVDEVSTVNMQSREEGIKDTMLDLIVDLLGAVAMGVIGWVYLRTGRYSFIADGVRSFKRRNPWLFRKPRGKEAPTHPM